jgi:glycosyltransferase involved in cell wall biosynthesis
MKILLINEFQKYGGTEIQSLREIRRLREGGNEVFYLTFDNSLPQQISLSEGWANFHCSKTFFARLWNKFFVNPFLLHRLRRIGCLFPFDDYHLNNTFKCPKTVFWFLKNKKGFETIRDYSAVCFKNTCIKDDLSECEGYRNEDCRQCQHSLSSRLVAWYWKNNTKKRLASIKHFACPSVALTQKCEKNGYSIRTLTNSFDFSIVKKTEPSLLKPHRFLFYGLISENKGVVELIKAFRIHCQKFPESQLLIAGKEAFSSPESKALFHDALVDSRHFLWLGSKENSEIMDLYPQIYCVIVPSLWLENYPNTVLEAIANKTLVIGSDRGGIPEMIGDSRFLFDPKDPSSLADCLSAAETISESAYRAAVEKAFLRSQSQNSSEAYYKKTMGLLEEINHGG